MQKYNHKEIEQKWQKKWSEQNIYDIDKNTVGEKGNFYLLDMFPYPSGDGLHMGHTEGYSATDIYYRYKRMQGYNVLHPQGFDSFGLPAENYAIKTGTHPTETTKTNSDTYVGQWNMLGLGHDFKNIIHTSSPDYYKWTQWLFGQFLEHDLVYKKTDTVNWCDSCHTILANEQVENGACERCKSEIVQKEVPGWFFRITNFADDLISGLDTVDWPEATKKKQINWIGKSEGSEIDFQIVEDEYIDINRDGGADSYKDGVEEVERFNVVVIIEHPTDEKYLCAQWKQVDWKGFVTGGIEDGDTIEETALKEVREETGYKNPEIVQVYSQSSHGKFYHVGKNINRFAHYRIVHVKLQDLEQEERSEEEQAIADMVWVEKDEVADFVTREDMRYPWRVVQGENTLDENITVFTTRADTLFGVTYAVLAPEHDLIKRLSDRITNNDEVQKYISEIQKKTELERLENKEKTGVRIEGIAVINPANGEQIPLYVADYVLAGYATGAVMAVPAHDERDFEFATKFNLPIKQTISSFFKLTCDSAPRKNKDIYEFKCASAIVRHWSEDKYLFIKFKGGQWGLVGGSVEEGENYDDAILRELEEETIFKNFIILNKLFEKAYGRGYKERKDREELCDEIIYEVRVLNQETSDDIAQDEGIDEWGWFSKDEVSKLNLISSHKYYFEHSLKKNRATTGEGSLINSGEYDGMNSNEAKKAITEHVGGRLKSTYRLRDWSLSRQRYWGCPIPIVYDPQGNAHFVGEDNLPWLLPTDVDFVPTGVSPLAKSDELKNRATELFGEGWTPEFDTMDTFVDSSWYFLRYPDTNNDQVFCSPKQLKNWIPAGVDLYIGGAEHTYMHLLYARFFTKAMHKMGLIDFDEPFKKLRHQGMVNDKNGVKMSKSKGNVVNPNEMVARFGADAVRTYMMFAAPLEDDVIWNEDNIVGVYRFLEKVWGLQEIISTESSDLVTKELHKLIKAVGEQIEDLKYNTPVSDMMKFVNIVIKEKMITKDQLLDFVKVLSPYAPHMCDEIAASLGSNPLIVTNWPTYDESMLGDDVITIGVQVNGKRRGDISVAPDAAEAVVLDESRKNETISKWLSEGEIKKVIYIPGKILNIIVG